MRAPPVASSSASRLGFPAGAIHVADCYRYWLEEMAEGRPSARFAPADYRDAEAVVRLFRHVDGIVEAFLRGYADRLDCPLGLRVRWMSEALVVTPLWLLTHVVTHEFHHKGQMVALGRLQGYPPPETDLIVP
ncbi:MAG: DinB family protein [Firmicutes bacterium]|nr:DinB family protein [Bacillota bacterium]